jgi:hypothetical protein
VARYSDALLEDLPGYRKIHAPLQMNIRVGPEYHTGRGVTPQMLSEDMRDLHTTEVPIPWGIAEIKASAADPGVSGTLHVSHRQGAEIAARMSTHLRSTMDLRFIEVFGVYWAVAPSALHGLLDRVRTRLTLFVAELRATMVPGDQQPSDHQVARAFSAIQVSVGDNSPVVIHAPQAVAEGGTAEVSGSQSTTPVPPPGADPVRGRSWRRG